MQVDVIDTYEAFAACQSNWDAIYQADPEAQLFLSWIWLSPYFKDRSHHWLVLAARPEGAGEYVAFLPLRVTTRRSGARGVFLSEFHMAGSFGWADYTGAICLPDREHEAIPALAAALRQMNWASLNLKHLLMSEQRMNLFMPAFADPSLIITRRMPSADPAKPDNSRCPYVDLPGDFETYLKDKLSSNSRQKLRRLLRDLDGSQDLRMTLATDATYERDADILITFWKKLWAGRKGADLHRLAAKYRKILLLAARTGNLFMPVLWLGDRPLGVLGTLIDPQKKSLLYFIAGRDDAFTTPSPGLLMHGWSIRWAIEHGFTTYDFLRGNEPFKYSFGCAERHIHNITIGTQSHRNPDDALDPRSMDVVLNESIASEKAGDVRAAIVGYRQILQARPDHLDLLQRQSRLLYQQGEYAQSLQVCIHLVAQTGADASDWRQLGKAHLAMKQYAQAESALRTANRLAPTIAGHHYLAAALTAQTRESEALAELAALAKLTPRGRRETEQKKQAIEKLGG